MNLEEISDRLEIQGLMVEYCDAIDTRNWDALDDVFTSDAIIDYSEMVGVKGTLPIQACQHIISTSKIKVEDDRRTICTNSMVFKPKWPVLRRRSLVPGRIRPYRKRLADQLAL